MLPRYGIDDNSVKMKFEELLHSDYFTVSWLSRKLLERASAFMIESSLSFRDFNEWIISYDAHSRNVSLATFDNSLSEKCKKLGVRVIGV